MFAGVGNNRQLAGGARYLPTPFTGLQHQCNTPATSCLTLEHTIFTTMGIIYNKYQGRLRIVITEWQNATGYNTINQRRINNKWGKYRAEWA